MRNVGNADASQQQAGTAFAMQSSAAAGGGAGLTDGGAKVFQVYRAIECDAERAVIKRLPQLLALIRPAVGAQP